MSEKQPTAIAGTQRSAEQDAQCAHAGDPARLADSAPAQGAAVDFDETEEALLARYLIGDDLAFERLERQYRPWLYVFFRRSGVPHEVTLDLVQNSLVALLLVRDSGTYEPSHPLKVYMNRVAINQLTEHWRDEARRKRRIRLPVSDRLGEPGDETGVDLEDLLGCIRRLQKNHRDYILSCGRHGLGEMSHAEMAAAIGCSEQAVSKISRRAREELKRLLEKRGYR